jgi:hypothetical protein
MNFAKRNLELCSRHEAGHCEAKLRDWRSPPFRYGKVIGKFTGNPKKDWEKPASFRLRCSLQPIQWHIISSMAATTAAAQPPRALLRLLGFSPSDPSSRPGGAVVVMIDHHWSTWLVVFLCVNMILVRSTLIIYRHVKCVFFINDFG